MKVGRNDLCPCGSGRKFKLCHLNTARSVAPWRNTPSPDTVRKVVAVAKGAAQLNAKMHKLETFRQHFGAVLPPSHVNAFGKRLVGIANGIYQVDERSSFFDVLRGHVQEVLGPEWWEAERGKPAIALHPIARWEAHALSLIENGERKEDGRVIVTLDGLFIAYMCLAYDLFVVRNNTTFFKGIVERLRLRDSFAGVAYELLVAAIFARAGFELFPEDEKTSPPKPPEFTAVDRETKFAVAVEAKSRNRRQSDTNPERVQMDEHISDAAKKSHGSKPFVVFLDVAMPPLPSDVAMPEAPAWLDEVNTSLAAVRDENGDSPFDWVVITNFPYRYAQSGEPKPRGCFATSEGSRMPADVKERLLKSISQYANIPEFEDTPP
jgi:hypothetical protein